MQTMITAKLRRHKQLFMQCVFLIFKSQHLKVDSFMFAGSNY